MVLVEVVSDCLTTESLSRHPDLMLEYVLMILTLALPIACKLYMLGSFLQTQGSSKPAFKEWLEKNRGFASLVVYVLIVLKFDCSILLTCKMFGMHCMSAPVDNAARAYLETRGTLDLFIVSL